MNNKKECNTKVYKVKVFCNFCGDILEVEALLPLNDEEKEGWICEKCEENFKKIDN
jgi:hypothetical protein